MTVCVGVPFQDGVVLAADTQITHDNYKDYAPKIGYAGNGTHCVAIAGSGYLDLLNHTIDRLNLRLTALEVSAVEEVEKAIQAELTYICREFKRDAKYQFLLCAMTAADKKPKLLSFRQNVPSEERDVAIIGCGNVELTRFLKSLLQRVPETDQEALHWAVYLVQRAKSFVNGCGGDTDAILVRNDTSVEVIPRKRTEYLEAYIAGVESEVSESIFKLMFSKVNESEYRLKMKALSNRLWLAREESSRNG